MTAIICGVFHSCQNRCPLTEKNNATAKDQVAAYLVAKSIDATVVLLPQSQMDESFFAKSGVPKDVRGRFVALYDRLRRDLPQMREEYRERQGIRYFLLNRYLAQSGDSVPTADSVKYQAVARNPVFMGFALLAEELPVWENIGNIDYIQTLARSFKVSPNEINEGIWICLKNGPALINEAVALMVAKNLQDTASNDPDFFFNNVLVPYCTYISKGKRIYDSLENRVFGGFHQVFEQNRGGNTLQRFIAAFKGYLDGAPLNVRFRNDLNRVLAGFNYRLAVRDKACVAYSILNYRIPIRRQGINDVVFLRKASVSLSLALLGSATSSEKDVMVSYDNIADYAQDIRYAVENQKPYSLLKMADSKSWNELSTGFNLDSANRIIAMLLQDFAGQPDSVIISKVVFLTALHEVKHKWDETTGADKNWYNVDCEASACLTGIAFSNIPRYALVHFIYTFQNFFTAIRSEEVHGTVGCLLKEAWRVAQAATADTTENSGVQKAAEKIYAEYQTLARGTLPDLSLFKSQIVDSCFHSVPEFSNLP